MAEIVFLPAQTILDAIEREIDEHREKDPKENQDCEKPNNDQSRGRGQAPGSNRPKQLKPAVSDDCDNNQNRQDCNEDEACSVGQAAPVFYGWC